MFHELVAYNAYRELFADLSYWRLASGIEVDFVIGAMQVAIETKAATKITSDHLRGLRHLSQDHPRARRIVVCLEPKRRRTEDGIEILPVRAFLDSLAELFAG